MRRDRLTQIDEQPTVKMLLEYHGKEILLPRDEQKRPSPAFLRKKIELAA